MESLGEILKRIQTSTSREDSDISLDAESPQPPEPDSECPICRGAGWVRRDVPVGDPDFGKAIPCECQKREFEEGRRARLERYGNLGPLVRLTFDNLIPTGRSGDPAKQERFNRSYEVAKSFAQNPQGWIVLTGASGCGKTHLAAAIANHSLTQGRPAFFIVVPDLLDHLRSTFAPNSEVSYDELFEQVRSSPLLVLDDLGTQSSTPWAQEKLFQILNHRFNAQLPTVVTTNTPLEELEERLLTRLTDPTLSQVLVVEESRSFVLESIGAMELELLSRMTLETFDWKRVNLPLGQRQNLEDAFQLASDFARKPENWLVFIGDHGCGKTHLAAAIANYRLQAGQSVFFVVVPDLLDHLRFTFSPESNVTYDQLFEKVRTTPLLILDDLGSQSTTPWAQEKLYQIINYRYNARLPTVITTYLRLDDIETRIASRIGDLRLSMVHNITAPDYRIDLEPVRRPRGMPSRGRGSRFK